MIQSTKISDMDMSKDFLKVTDFENFFDIYIDGRGKDLYNLNSTLYLDIPLDTLLVHKCDTYCFWPLISYKIYGTTRLAWLLMKLNAVSAEDVFLPKKPGDQVLYLPQESLGSILRAVNDKG